MGWGNSIRIIMMYFSLLLFLLCPFPLPYFPFISFLNSIKTQSSFSILSTPRKSSSLRNERIEKKLTPLSKSGSSHTPP
jgi:hypothetical protein